MTSNLITVLAVATVILCFLLLVRLVRDPRITTPREKLVNRLAKLIMFCVILSQMGMVLYPELARQWWTLFDASVLFALVVYYRGYYVTFADVKVSGPALLKISDVHYSRVAPGCWAKIYKRGAEAVMPHEIDLIGFVESVDPPPGSQIIFHTTQSGNGFGEHEKPLDELVWLMEGQARITETQVLDTRTCYRIERGTRHFYLAIGHATGVSIEYPPGTDAPACETD